MSEYIYWQDDSWMYKREEIVRCRDCEHVSFDEFGIGWCNENCREVKPWDFCAWGERQTINKIDDSVIHDHFDSLFDKYIIDGICAWGERKGKENDRSND